MGLRLGDEVWGFVCIDDLGASMEQLVLVPAVYRCPDHDNVDIVTTRVRDRVLGESVIHAERASAPFRVAITCPGRAGAPETAHVRVCEGVWSRALRAAS